MSGLWVLCTHVPGADNRGGKFQCGYTNVPSLILCSCFLPIKLCFPSFALNCGWKYFVCVFYNFFFNVASNIRHVPLKQYCNRIPTCLHWSSPVCKASLSGTNESVDNMTLHFLPLAFYIYIYSTILSEAKC